MLPTIACFCDSCKKYARLDIADGKVLVCPSCQKQWGVVEQAAKVLDRCPLCAGRQFYTDKDFNQLIGWIFMGVGIILVPLTYGLSLAVLALVDFFMRKRIKTMVVCYKCGGEYRNVSAPVNLKPFMHPIGLKYDKYR